MKEDLERQSETDLIKIQLHVFSWLRIQFIRCYKLGQFDVQAKETSECTLSIPKELLRLVEFTVSVFNQN